MANYTSTRTGKQADEIRSLRARLAVYRKSTHKETTQIGMVVDSLPATARRYIRDLVLLVAAGVRDRSRAART